MPPRKQPPSLKEAALRASTRLITYQIRLVMSTSSQRHERRLRWLADAMCSLPESVAGGVLAAALRSMDVFLNYRNNHPARRALEKLLTALLPPSTRRFALPTAESYPLRQALLRHIQALPMLRDLTLTNSMHVHTSVDVAVAALSTLRHLVTVRAPWLCSDAMAVALGQHCPSLEQLDASESTHLSDRGVVALASGCPRLRVLLLTGCRVSENAYEHLLSKLPALQRIGSCPSLGAVVRAAARPPTLLSLVEWDSDHAPDEEEAALCPRLESVALTDVLVVPDPTGVHLPAAVERLRVSWAGLRDHATRVPLHLHANLSHLDMMDHALTVADAVELGRQCPALRVLKLAMWCSGPQPQPVPVHPARQAPFRQLQEFHLYSGPGPLLEYVLVHATALSKVSVTPGMTGDAAPAWTDAVMRRVMGQNPLLELASFYMACPCDLTMDTVYALMLGCPKLRALYDLREWDVSETQMSELQDLVVANNWDLELGLVAP